MTYENVQRIRPQNGLILTLILIGGFQPACSKRPIAPPSSQRTTTTASVEIKLPANMLALINYSKDGASWREAFYEMDGKLPELKQDEVDVVRKFIMDHPTSDSYYLLLLLRQLHPRLYESIPNEIKARVLVSFLEKGDSYNDWGHLDGPINGESNEPAQALVATGTPAVPLLSKLLGDTKPALFTGSEDATLSTVREYRVCDFAYRFIELIQKRDPAYSSDLAVRDRNIAELRSHVAQ